MFQSESFNFDDFTSQPVFMSCPVEIYSYFNFCVRVQSPCPDFPLRLSFLMTLRCPGPGMSCNSRDCESLVIFDNLSKQQQSCLGQPEHEVTFYPRAVTLRSGQVPLISEIVSEKSGASCFYLGDRPRVDSPRAKREKLIFHVDEAIKRGPELEATF